MPYGGAIVDSVAAPCTPGQLKTKKREQIVQSAQGFWRDRPKVGACDQLVCAAYQRLGLSFTYTEGGVTTLVSVSDASPVKLGKALVPASPQPGTILFYKALGAMHWGHVGICVERTGARAAQLVDENCAEPHAGWIRQHEAYAATMTAGRGDPEYFDPPALVAAEAEQFQQAQ